MVTHHARAYMGYLECASRPTVNEQHRVQGPPARLGPKHSRHQTPQTQELCIGQACDFCTISGLRQNP